MSREYRRVSVPVGLRPARGVYVALAVLVGVSVAGFFVGVSGGATGRPKETQTRETVERVGSDAGAAPAVDYRWMEGKGRGPNREWVNSLENRKESTPELLAPVVPDPTKKGEALAKRAERRAYDGAPPVVPHPIAQMSAASCLACHGEGLKVEKVVAPKISHEKYTSCTQCHVEGENKAYPAGGEIAANLFQGRAAPKEGERAWAGAPPTIPHSTWMREDCMSCHGANGASPMRTSHPWRVSCVQCHGQSGEMNQQPVKLSEVFGGEK